MGSSVEKEVKNFEFKGAIKKVSLGLMGLWVLGFVISFTLHKKVGLVDLVVNNLYFTMMAVSAIFFLALAGVVQASWLTPYKRIPEAMLSYLPWAAVITIGSTLVASKSIYKWMDPIIAQNDFIIAKKIAWLNQPRFMVTMVVIFALWIILAKMLKSYSDKMDGPNGAATAVKFVNFSAKAIIIFAFSICVAAFDWIMSIEPHWFSTIFGVYIFAGSFVTGISFVTLAVIYLKDRGYLGHAITEDHYHDLGKWMFGMSVFWAYIWISQYLLIWYANIPEETEYYVLRHHHWNTIFFANLAVNFFIPFFALMTRAAKRDPKRLKIVATILLLGHFVDMYLMVAPKIFEKNSITSITGSGILQALQLVGGFGIFVYIVGSALAKRKLLVTEDPTFEEGVHLHQ